MKLTLFKLLCLAVICWCAAGLSITRYVLVVAFVTAYGIANFEEGYEDEKEDGQ